MISIKLVCVGSLKEKFWRDACEEYVKRLSKFCKLKIVECQQKELDDIQKGINLESNNVLENVNSYSILLDRSGKMLSSEEFAQTIEKLSLNNSELTFIIGGSYGVNSQVKNKADMLLSFGKVTYPHNLARVILLEQLYRSFMITSGSKYHK